jgi:hypothetical protein
MTLGMPSILHDGIYLEILKTSRIKRPVLYYQTASRHKPSSISRSENRRIGEQKNRKTGEQQNRTKVEDWKEGRYTWLKK